VIPVDGRPDGSGTGHGPRFREAIEADRVATDARLRSLRSEIDGIVAASADANADDEHDPEGATIAFERARSAALLADAEAHRSALDRARDRLEAGTYAVCEECGGPIGQERLTARPAVSTCVGCAAALHAGEEARSSSRSTRSTRSARPTPPRP